MTLPTTNSQQPTTKRRAPDRIVYEEEGATIKYSSAIIQTSISGEPKVQLRKIQSKFDNGKT
jgi:hypothetical protein